MTMHNKTLEIKTATIEIKVIRVDGHKMTKATFRQIPHDTDSILCIDEIIGWVKDRGIFVLWADGGNIKKRRIIGNNVGEVVYNLRGEGLCDYLTSDNTFEYQNDLLDEIKQSADQLYIAT